jgi:hypothetical protein
MECATIYCDTDSGPEAFLFRQPKANKEHTCGECKRIIKKGETYVKESGIWEGRPNTYKTCLDCLSLRRAFFDQGWYFEEIICSLKEHISDLDGAVPASCFENLTQAAKNMLYKMMDEYIDDWEE